MTTTLQVDLHRSSQEGLCYANTRGEDFQVGSKVAAQDEDTYEAEVIGIPRPGVVLLHVHLDRVLESV